MNIGEFGGNYGGEYGWIGHVLIVGLFFATIWGLMRWTDTQQRKRMAGMKSESVQKTGQSSSSNSGQDKV